MDVIVTKADGTTQTVSGNSVVLSPSSIVVPPPNDTQLFPGNKLSQGISGKYWCGLNVHGDSDKLADIVAGLGGDAMRVASFFRGYSPDWPGNFLTDTTALTNAKRAIALGMRTLVIVTNWWANVNHPQWSNYVRQVVQKTGCSFVECENEPNFNTGGVSPEAYFECLKLTYAAVKSANPACQVGAPTTNASFVAANQSWCAKLMALPGFFDYLDFWTFHPYNQTPETSWFNDTDSVRSRVEARQPSGKGIEFWNTEAGWKGTQSGEGSGDPSAGYSKQPFIHRASGRMRASFYYTLYDGPYGPMGIVGKAWAPIVKDAFERVRAATECSMYVRESNGSHNTNANWYVRTNVPGTQELCLWSVGGNRNCRVVVDSPSAGFMNSRMVGSANAPIPLVAGRQAITVPLTVRGRLLTGKGLSFPEFQS